MALKKCKECGELVSSKAAACPRCGAVLKHKGGCLSTLGKLLIILVIGYLVIDFMRYTKNGPGPNSGSVPRSVSGNANLQPVVPAAKVEPMEHIFKEGDNVCIDEFCFIVWRSWWSDSLGNNPFIHSKKADAMYLFVDMTIQNNDSTPRIVRNFKIVDQNGYAYEISNNSWIVEGAIGIYEKINPTVSRRGIYVYDLPQNRQYHMKLISNMFRSNAAYVRLDPNGIKSGSEEATKMDPGKDRPEPESATAKVATPSPESMRIIASFDCSMASTQVEKIICSHPDLCEADIEMVNLYNSRLNNNSYNRDIVKQEQREWLKNKRNVCAGYNCLRDAYDSRIEQLSQ